MAYTHITFGAAKTLLAARLGDPSKIFWTDTELAYSLIEAKRIWNAVTLHDRDRGNIETTAGTEFYQLTTSLRNTSNTLIRAHTIRDRQLVSEIEFHLMEPQNLTSWSGTDQFTFNQILTAIQRRRDQFLADTACVLTERQDFVDSSGLVEMSDTVIGVRRAVFTDPDGRYYTLRTTDDLLSTLARGFWPSAFSVAASPNLNVRVIPAPSISGNLETLIVSTGTVLDTTANANAGTLIGVPDDYVWAIKYGALADLYQDIMSVDPRLGAMAEGMYKLGVQLALKMPVILRAQISSMSVLPSSLHQIDALHTGWQGRTMKIPTKIGVAGPDLIALADIPDDQYTVQLDVVRTATVPSSSSADGEYLDVGREHLDALLGMAQRICMIKMGGDEFTATDMMASKFFDQASEYSYRRSAASTALQVMNYTSGREMSNRPWKRVPRTVEDRSEEVALERNARRRPFRQK